MKIAQIKAKIISNQRYSGNYWHLEFESGLIAQQAVAGQFINIRVNDVLVPLLRRPLSIHGIKGNKVKVIYEVLGKGTQALSSRKPKELLDIIGPLGNGFNYQVPAKSKAAKNILIAGGIGVAPLVFLAEKLNKPLVLIGGRSKDQVLCAQEFKALGCNVKIATDDGSFGYKGRVTDLFNIILGQTKPTQVFSCGPHLMLKTVAQIAKENKIPAQLSLEAHMACGIGVCLGCAVETRAGYKTVCKDGPVFSSEDIIW
jgi:dihydroorotate dehydrogenase electron transfer subunit